ncbi:hypothetical protein [Salmonella enterica]|uniref:hypothetical protein n=1 Tax=Salmonella enterica TaxID=28901 RepID=UPI0016036103|nr:hypothetical protein [Salmonella enterica]HCL4920577.1 hypothetical protein [Salmonella enterica]
MGKPTLQDGKHPAKNFDWITHRLEYFSNYWHAAKSTPLAGNPNGWWLRGMLGGHLQHFKNGYQVAPAAFFMHLV